MFLSIIIPVYNVEEYLELCVESILKSAFSDYEVLLVIGKSSDRSNQICYGYAKKNHRIRVIIQDGTGLSNARNCGLMAADGTYIMYADSDDFLDTQAFEHTIKKLYLMPDHDLEVLISDFYLADAFGQVYGCRRQIKETAEIITDYEYLGKFLRSRKNYCNVWRYLYRRDFLLENQLFSKEGFKSEDLDYSTRVLLSVKRCGFYHNPYYCYRVRRSGSLVNVVTMQNVDNLLDILCDCIERVRADKRFPYCQLLINKLVWEYFFNFLFIEDITPASQKAEARQKMESKMYLLKNASLGTLFYWFVRIGGIRFWGKALLAGRCMKRRLKR